MSMTRDEAIRHFGVRKYAGVTVCEALALAPSAVRNGLHPADITWVSKYKDVDSNSAVARLMARHLGNPDGLIATSH